MSNTLNTKYAVTAIVGLGIVAWLAALFFKGISVPFTVEALKEIPAAAGYVATATWLFSKWGWKLPIFRGWLVLVPNLNGTWKGVLRSTWVDDVTKQKRPPIDAYLVIRQTLTRISVTLLTEESKSRSSAASIEIDNDHSAKVLEMTYTNSPKVSVHERSKAHDGAAVLDIISEPSKKLEGKYWTDRETKGEMEFKFSSKKYRESFK